MSLTRHCWKCGTEYKLSGSPGRSETCASCGADLKVCMNCVSYDSRAAYQCRDRRAEPVEDKGSANYCEYFELIRREYVKKVDAFGASREAEARDTLKKLLGGD
jgi:ribosome-binding protein aMBF1 (putative translation factor)